MEGVKYNFVIFGYEEDFYRAAFNDINKVDGVEYVSFEIVGELHRNNIIYHYHCGSLNKYINLPFKGLWNNRYFYSKFEEDKPLCFIFMGAWISLNEAVNLSSYLRKTYPNCKIVLFLSDLLSTRKQYYKNRSLDITCFNYLYDLVISYDKSDCTKYGFLYHPTVMSYMDIEDNSILDSDVYFLGKDKGRLPLIKKMLNYFNESGFKCDFNVLCKCGRDFFEDGIHFISKPFSYKDNICHVKKTKSILEIMQANADGFTFRTWESLLYHKLLITNNNASGLENFNNVIHINLDGTISDNLESVMDKSVVVDESLIKKISPIEFLKFINSNL